MYFLRVIFFSLAFLFPAIIFAQEGVRKPVSREVTGKIMIVPFEPKMYMSDIDVNINRETKWTQQQIRSFFRKQLEHQFKLQFQSISAPLVSFWTDSAKTADDLSFIYKSTVISFDKTDHPTEPGKENAPAQTGVKNGQIVVEISDDKKFANIKLSNSELISYLHKKYKSDYFIFINELDIMPMANSYDMTTDSYKREVTVHFTIIDSTSKLILAGAATSTFSSTVNDPKKIVTLTFRPIATYLAGKFKVAVRAMSKLRHPSSERSARDLLLV